MGQTMRRKQRKPASRPLPEVLTLSEAARFLRLPAKEVERLALEESLPGRKIGKEWRFWRRAIQAWLAREVPASLLEQAGAWAGDADQEEFRERLRQIRAEWNDVA